MWTPTLNSNISLIFIKIKITIINLLTTHKITGITQLNRLTQVYGLRQFI